jgi:hypothetical protein
MKTFTSLAVVLFCMVASTSTLFSQTVSKEKILLPASKDLGFRGAYGIKSIYTTSGNTSRSLTPIFEFGDLNEDGFIYRDKFHFTKYTNDFEKVWESDIEKSYSLQAMATGQVAGNNFGTYFYECATNPGSFNHATITKFSATGKTDQTKFVNNKRFTNFLDVVVNSKGFNFIAYKFDSKEKTIKYYLITFSHSNLAEKVTELNLPVDEYEVKNYNYEMPLRYLWVPVKTENDRIIFAKAYTKKPEGSKEVKELVISIADYAPDKKVEIKNFQFANNKAFTAKFVAPSVTVDLKNNSLFLQGLMSTSSTNIMDALYSYKYDLTSTKVLYSKEIPLTEISTKMGWNDKFKERIGEASLLTYAQSLSLEGVLDPQNKLITLWMDGGASGLSRNKAWFYGVSLDENGTIVKIEEFFYSPNPALFVRHELVPNQYAVLYKDKSKTFVPTPIEYIWKQAKEGGDAENILWSVFDRENSATIISINDKNSEIRSYKITK